MQLQLPGRLRLTKHLVACLFLLQAAFCAGQTSEAPRNIFDFAKDKSGPPAGKPGTPSLDKPSSEALLKTKGLSRVETRYLLAVDADLPNLLRAVRAAKVKADAGAARRAELERQIETANAAALAAMRELSVLHDRLSGIKKSDTRRYNEVVGLINEAELRQKEAMLAAQSRTKELRKLGDGQDDYVGLAIALAEKMQAAARQYNALADDPDVRAALAAVSAGGPRFTLGPSAAFGTELPGVLKTRDMLAARAIKLSTDKGVPCVQVTLNGTTQVPMVVDSGASTIVLSASTAKECGLRPGKNDPVVSLHTADGKVTQARAMRLDSVRVGPYTVANVECAVMPESVRSPNLLGGSFLKNFICRMDLGTQELHLSPVGGQVTVADVPGVQPKPLPGGPTTTRTTDGSGPIDLMALFDPAKDIVKGRWESAGQGLVSDRANESRVVFPYQPPDEYDLAVEFTRLEGTDYLLILFTWGGHNGACAIKSKLCGFSQIDKRRIGKDNPTVKNHDGIITTGKRHRCVLEVRRQGIRALIDNVEVTSFAGRPEQLSQDGNWDIKIGLLGVAKIGDGRFAFHTAELRPVSGEGKPLRPDGPANSPLR